MRFSVPQYITIEDKLRLGPLAFTIPQLLIVFVAFLICFAIFKIFSTGLALILSLIIITLAGVIGFLKINNKYVYNILPRLILSLISTKKYVWKEEIKITTTYINSPTLEKFIELAEAEEEEKVQPVEKPKEEKEEVDKPLSLYVKKAIERGYNPYNPYINFPVPRFPKRRW